MHTLHQRVVVRAAKLPGQNIILCQQSLHLAHSTGDSIEYCHIVLKMRFLIDIRDLDPLLHYQQAVIQLGQARDNLQQRRFAGAVASDQADPFAGFEGKFRVIEQRDVAERELRAGEGDDCHMPVVPGVV